MKPCATKAIAKKNLHVLLILQTPVKKVEKLKSMKTAPNKTSISKRKK